MDDDEPSILEILNYCKKHENIETREGDESEMICVNLTSCCLRRCFLWKDQLNLPKLYLLLSFGQRRWAYKPY